MELIVGGGMRDSKEWEMASEKDSIVAREREPMQVHTPVAVEL